MTPFIARVERDALLVCVVLAGLAAFWPGGGWRLAGAVLAGGALAGYGYLAMKGLVEALGPGGRYRWALVKFFTRHAILAVAAYGMLARLRLDPLAVIAGASSLVVAITIAAARTLGPVRRSGDPR